MSHTYGNGNSSGNSYLSRKRMDDDMPSYYYDKYDNKFDKYGNHSNPRYNNSMGCNYSKPPLKMNNYHPNNSRYYNNYCNRQKPFYSNMGYSNGFSQKRDYRKPYQKISAPGSTESIRNLSHCDMPSTSPLSIPQRKSTESLKTSETNASEIKPGTNLNIKNINYVPNMSQGHQIISPQNININIKVSSSNTNLKFNRDPPEENKKWKKKEDIVDKERRYDLQLIPFPQPSPSLMNFRPFDKSLVKIEPNPLEKFVLYPNHLYELNLSAIYNSMKRTKGTPIKELINRDKITDILSMKSCYLLAKIPNWRLVTDFVPASRLTNEKFSKIIPLDEDEEEKKEEMNKKEIKYSLIYNDKYEDIVEKYLEENVSNNKNIESRIFNEESIVAQYHYNTLKLKNKLKQGFFRINYLNNKQENLKNAVEENNKSHSFHFSDFS